MPEKKPPKTYIHKFKHYFSFNKYEETRIYTSRAGSSFYNVKMTDFNDNMVEQIFKCKKPWEVTSFQYKSKENEDGFTVNTLADWQYLHSFSDKIKREGEGDDQWGHRRTLYNQF